MSSMHYDWSRRLLLYATVVYRQSALLISDSKDGNPQQALFTTSFTKFLKEVERTASSDHFSAALYYRLMSSSVTESGGWFALLFSCKLIDVSLRSNLPVSAMIKGFSLALADTVRGLSVDSLKDPSNISLQLLKLSWDDLDNILCVIRTTLSNRHTLHLSHLQIDKISVNFLSAFLSSIEEDSKRCSIIYRQSVGLPIENIIVLEHSLVMDIPIPVTLLRSRDRKLQRKSCKFQSLIVVIFENSLEFSELPNASFEITQGDALESEDKCEGQLDSMKSVEYAFLENIASVFKRSNITLVACQRRIHPYLIRILHRYGIISLPRLSIRYCGALQRLCGARQLLSFPNSKDPEFRIDPYALGYLASIECSVLHGRKYVVACAKTRDQGDQTKFGFDEREEISQISLFDAHCSDVINSRKSLMCTAILIAPSEALCCELQSTLEDVSLNLISLLSCPYVLPGAGLWQAHTAKCLREKLMTSKAAAEKRVHMESFSIGKNDEVLKAAEIFISCLEDCSQVIGGAKGFNCSLHASDATFILPIREVSGDSADILFHNPLQRCTVRSSVLTEQLNSVDSSWMNAADNKTKSKRVLTADALEAAGPCLAALQLAVDAAICVLDVDGLLTSYPQEIRKDQY